MAKLPWPDPDEIAAVDVAEARVGEDLWRVHAPAGTHPMRWNELRTFGPLPSARFDPWPPPPSDRRADPVTIGVGYFGFDISTCLAEVFQSRRIVDCQGGAQLTAFNPARSLTLIDLRGGWPLLIGASHLINSGPKDRSRAWALAIREVHPGHDGFLFTGMAGRNCLALYDPPGGVFPAFPSFSKSLADPALVSYIANAAEQIGYGVRS